MSSNTWVIRIGILTAAVVTLSLPLLLAIYIVPLGEGPDELSHIDYAFFTAAHPHKEFDVERGLYEPGSAPLGQGHQPPLSYDVWAQLLRVFVRPSEIGAFVDYQAGLLYDSAGGLYGGVSACSYRHDDRRNDEPQVRAFRRSMWLMRASNAVFFFVAALATYLAAITLFPEQRLLAVGAMLFHASVPNAIWRSVFVNNDNPVATLSSIVFALGAFYLAGRVRRTLPVAVLLGALAAAAFLSKYSGIAALGFALLAVLLRRGESVPRKLAHLTVVIFVFAALVAPDLLENLRVEGDLFSKGVVAHVVPMLYRPSSLTAVLLDPHFIPQLFSRFWMEFHNQGGLDPTSPFTIVRVWFAILGIAGAGVILWTARRYHSTGDMAALLYTVGCIAGSVFVICYYGATFPLPGGRYLHIALTPISLLIALGLTALLKTLLRSRAPAIATALLAAHVVLGSWLTLSYLGERYNGCLIAGPHTVPAGLAVRAADIDADGTDELLLFHRIRSRLFVAKLEDGNFQIVPRWTRAVGLPGDTLLADDLNGDGFDDVVFYRRGTGWWFGVDGRSIVYPSAEAAYTDIATQPIKFEMVSSAGDAALLADVDHNGTADLLAHRESTGAWYVNASFSADGTIDKGQEFEARFFGGDNNRGISLNLQGRELIGTYELRHARLMLTDFFSHQTSAPITLKFKLRSRGVTKNTVRPIARLVTGDLDGDETDEFVVQWQDRPCYTVWFLADRSSPAARDHGSATAVFADAASRRGVAIAGTEVCSGDAFEEIGAERRQQSALLGEHEELFPIRGVGRSGTAVLASFNYASGIVKYLIPGEDNRSLVASPDRREVQERLSPNQSTVRQFDPGFSGGYTGDKFLSDRGA